jgi:hypothetical protein
MKFHVGLRTFTIQPIKNNKTELRRAAGVPFFPEQTIHPTYLVLPVLPCTNPQKDKGGKYIRNSSRICSVNENYTARQSCAATTARVRVWGIRHRHGYRGGRGGRQRGFAAGGRRERLLDGDRRKGSRGRRRWPPERMKTRRGGAASGSEAGVAHSPTQ